jgi:hypothetical protein
MSKLCHVRESHAHGPAGTVVYGGRTYDCRKVLQSIESSAGPGVYPQPIFGACVSQ